MRKITLLLSLLLAIMSAGMAQKIIQDQGFFRNILKDSTNVLEILSGGYGHAGNVYIPDLPYPVTTEPLVKFVKNSHGVFMSLDATGRIYQVQENEQDLNLIREDSTLFFGHNFGSSFFTYHDTLFSYGGYGYWHANGQLRYFKYDKAEWELMPLSKEIAARKGDADFSYNFWLDQTKGNFYVLKSTSHPDSVYVLNMLKKKWRTLGRRIHSLDLKYFISTPWGLMCSSGDNENSSQYMLLDFYHNSISVLSRSKTIELTALLYPNFKAFIKDSTVCIVKRFDPNGLDKINLSKSDFNKTNKEIYEPLPEPSVKNSVINFVKLNWHFIATFGAIFTLGLLLGKRIQKYIISKSTVIPIIARNTKVFELKEIDLVKLILSKSQLKQTTSIDEINRVLGLSEKSPDMQKKHRSDIITSINNKYRLISGSTENLLCSKRSIADKRSFEYLINIEKVTEISTLFTGVD